MKQLLPTPYVGLPIRWYRDDMNITDPIAATVTRIEGPGKISLYYVTVNGMLRHRSGVNWVGDDRRLAPGRPFRQNGVWDFLPDLKSRNATQYHKNHLAKEERKKAEAAKLAKQQREEVTKQHEELKAKVESNA